MNQTLQDGASETNLTLVFDGPAVQRGEIDIQDLAPALLAMSKLIKVANSTINSRKAKVSVKVRGTSEGSFAVDLILLQSFIEFATVHRDEIAAANELVNLIFQSGRWCSSYWRRTVRSIKNHERKKT